MASFAGTRMERKIACTVLGGPPISALGTSLVATNYSLFRPFEKKKSTPEAFLVQQKAHHLSLGHLYGV